MSIHESKNNIVEEEAKMGDSGDSVNRQILRTTMQRYWVSVHALVRSHTLNLSYIHTLIKGRLSWSPTNTKSL